MEYTRRDLGKFALALPGVTLLGGYEPLFAQARTARPNSKINGVQIGTITYSYRSMADQSAEATLKYIVDSGISAVELMGAPVLAYARARSGFQPSAGAGGAGGGGRGAANAAPAVAAAAPAPAAPLDPNAPQWMGQPCPAPRGGGPGPAPAGNAAGRAGTGAPADGGGRGRGAIPAAEQQAAADEQRKWRQSLSMDIFKDLRKMYNDAGVSIYAVKNISGTMPDEELDFWFSVAEALGCTHTTLELPSGPDAGSTLKRLGDWGLKRKIYVAYHTHLQGTMTAFDEAFAVSRGNMANVDLGHFVAGGNQGGTPLDFLNKFHGRISSFHLKDRTLPEHCSLNLAWGTGETPIKEILQLVKKNQWDIPATIELEYTIPSGSDAVQEVRKCVDYCRAALA